MCWYFQMLQICLFKGPTFDIQMQIEVWFIFKLSEQKFLVFLENHNLIELSEKQVWIVYI